MSQPATTSTPAVFHPAALAAIAALAGGRDDQPAWHQQALCAQTDPEAFFPENGASTREAKQICNSCEVRAECLEDALRRDERFGVWGAMSRPERRVLPRTGPTVADPTPRAEADHAVPEQRSKQARQGRESVPAPGRRAGSGMAGTLPTEPRGPRDRPARPASTFPARARSAPENPSLASAPTTAVRPAGRAGTRSPRTRPARRPSRLDAVPAPPMNANTDAAPPTTAAETPCTDPDAAPNEDLAAAAPDPPPDSGREHESQREQKPQLEEEPQGELGDVARRVLAAQRGAVNDGVDAGAGLDGLDGVEVDRVLAMVSAMTRGTGTSGTGTGWAARTSAPRWERRIAAVTAVLSGTLTRGKTARAIGVRSQDVAFWVAAHGAGMVLLRSDEQLDEHPGEDDTDGDGQPGVGER